MLKVVGASWMQIRMSTWIIGVVLVLGIVVVILGQMGASEEDGNYSATVYWSQETGFEIKFWGQGMIKEQIPKGVARIYFQPHTETTGIQGIDFASHIKRHCLSLQINSGGRAGFSLTYTTTGKVEPGQIKLLPSRWALVDIVTQSNYPDWVQAYAAGMLEGSLSWQLIYWHWKNTVKFTCENRETFCSYIKEYLEENLNFVKKHYNSDDPYWYQVYLFYVQLEGLQQGFEHGVKRSRQTVEELKFVDFLWMNAASDILDLEYKFFDTRPYVASLNHSDGLPSNSTLLKKIRNSRSVDAHTTENEHVQVEFRPLMGCGVTLASAFVRLLPDEGRLLVAHNSAGPYVSMLKMIKQYRFRFHWSASNLWVIENKLSFTSYPGAIHAVDDFYVLSVGSSYTDLIIAGTPLTVFEKNLWDYTSPIHQVLSGPRAIAASRLSKNASVWAETVSRYNSGTGNKQWIIVDAEIFNNISRLREEDGEKYWEELNKATDIFLLAEQIPGHFMVKDLTPILRSKTYWANYGLPFYKNISILSGVERLREVNGDIFSFENSPIARIYRRDYKNATTIDSTMKLMRSNCYRRDPLSMGNPRCAIGARGDIPSKTSFSFPIGVTDSKVYSLGEGGSSNDTDFRNSSSQILFRSSPNFQVVAGPAYSLSKADEDYESGDVSWNDRIKPFNWANSIFVDFPHEGHPDNWQFEPVNI